MKWAWLVVVVGAVVAFASSKSPVLGAPGRFQLFNGHYATWATGVRLENKGLFKIDSETGYVWLYSEEKNPHGEGVLGFWLLVGAGLLKVDERNPLAVAQ